jgi:Predicted hydrolases or acyltransferases (alpha/beta hydrolase superfamily)
MRQKGTLCRRFVKMVKRFKSQAGKQLLYESYDRLLDLWGVEKEERVVETMYGKTHVIISGNRTNLPLMLIHGTGDNSAVCWISNIQELSKHFYVIAVDTFAGAGKSEPNESYIKGFNSVLWIDEILNSLDIIKINIAGASYGVNLALSYAIGNPDRVNKIVCLAGYIPLKGIKYDFLILKGLMAFFPEILNLNEKNTIKLLRKICAPNSKVLFENKEVLNHWLVLFKYSKPQKQKMIKYEDKVFSSFREKTLFLIGEFDRFIYYPAVIEMLNGNKLNYKIIKNAGHAVHAEQADLINQETINFLLKEV